MDWGKPLRDLDAVRQMLHAIKDGTGALAVALFDDDLAKMYATSESSPEGFWRAFQASPCRSVDREKWYRDLRSNSQGEVRQECACATRHTTDGYLVHGRWILMVLLEGPMTLEAIDFNMLVPLMLASLPKKRVRRGGGPEPAHASLGIPLWWARGPA